MGSRYLTDLATVVRDAGLVVQEEGGWQSRSRSSGGYDGGYPNHVMVHHTASGASSDGQPDVNYMCYSSENRPVANLYLARSGKVWIMAAGATNTNGSGRCPHCGTTDNMNTRAIGIEAGNNGTGEPWPSAQQDAYITLCKVLCDHYGIANEAVQYHATYAPGRKIDPAGPSRWASSGTWPLDPFQADVAAGGGSAPIPGGNDEVLVLFRVTDAAKSGVHYRTNGVHYTVISDGDDEAALQLFMTKLGIPLTSVQTCTKAQVGFAGIYLDIGSGQPRANPYL